MKSEYGMKVEVVLVTALKTGHKEIFILTVSVCSYQSQSKTVTVSAGPAVHVKFLLNSLEHWSSANDFNIAENIQVLKLKFHYFLDIINGHFDNKEVVIRLYLNP
jgi:hypothetical protein